MTRQLHAYPSAGQRNRTLLVVVLVTIWQYYALYVHGSVSTKIMAEYGMSMHFYISISIIGTFGGALASFAGRLSDRYGRVNLMLAGLLVTDVLVFAAPHSGSKVTLLVLFVLAGTVEGATLVMSPALLRDFSPQASRGAVMGLWSLGPVLGSLTVSTVASHTLDTHPDWRFQLYVCATVGLVIIAIGAVGLRDLSPQLRSQIVRTPRERRVIEARAAAQAAGLTERDGLRLMLTPRIVLPALAFALYLLFYFSRVGFFVIYFVGTFGYSTARANALQNWDWAVNACALAAFGLLGDRLRVRKPLIVLGAAIYVSGLIGWTIVTTNRSTDYYTFALLLSVCAFGGGMATSNWLAAFSEAVERRQAAFVATGLAIWGWSIRVVGALALIAVTYLVSATGTLIDHGKQVQAISTRYAPELATLNARDASAADKQQAAVAIPAGDRRYLAQHGTQVSRALHDAPDEWQRWWWACVAGQLLFIPATWLLPGPWRLRRARNETLARDRDIAAALRELDPDAGARAVTSTS